MTHGAPVMNRQITTTCTSGLTRAGACTFSMYCCSTHCKFGRAWAAAATLARDVFCSQGRGLEGYLFRTGKGSAPYLLPVAGGCGPSTPGVDGALRCSAAPAGGAVCLQRSPCPGRTAAFADCPPLPHSPGCGQPAAAGERHPRPRSRLRRRRRRRPQVPRSHPASSPRPRHIA